MKFYIAYDRKNNPPLEGSPNFDQLTRSLGWSNTMVFATVDIEDWQSYEDIQKEWKESLKPEKIQHLEKELVRIQSELTELREKENER